MAELPNVRLNLANTAENVVVVRSVLSGIADSCGLDGNDLGDIRTAVTEACNNVVLHAYGGERGPMDVAIELGAGAIVVTVRDRGVGIGEHAREDADGVGIGLHVIRTLARSVKLDEPPGRGTRVRMELPASGVHALQPGLPVGPEADLAGAMSDMDAAIGIAPVVLARAVVPRLAYTLAARAHFSTDRLSDVQMLCDSLAARAGEAVCEQRVSIGVSVRPRDLQLRFAPLSTGRARGLIDSPDVEGLGALIETLADRHEILAVDSHETLALSLLDRSRR